VVGATDELGRGDDEGINEDGITVVGAVDGTADMADDEARELDDLDEEGAAEEGCWDVGWADADSADVGAADDSTAELDGAADDVETAELGVIGLDDWLTAEDSKEGLDAAEELSTVDVTVSEGTADVGMSEEATNDDVIEASKDEAEEAISEENDSASDDGAADLELALYPAPPPLPFNSR